jgi:hypothetical protein
MNRTGNRIMGATQTVIGLCWLVVFPLFLCFMVFMEGREADRPDSAVWRLWRALEILLVDPMWLGSLLSLLLLAASLLGGILLGVGLGVLRGTPQAQRWGIRAALGGIIYCGLGFLFHGALLMPVVRASQNPAVSGAAADLNRAGLVGLSAGLVSAVVASVIAFGARRPIGSAGNLPAST